MNFPPPLGAAQSHYSTVCSFSSLSGAATSRHQQDLLCATTTCTLIVLREHGVICRPSLKPFSRCLPVLTPLVQKQFSAALRDQPLEKKATHFSYCRATHLLSGVTVSQCSQSHRAGLTPPQPR